MERNFRLSGEEIEQQNRNLRSIIVINPEDSFKYSLKFFNANNQLAILEDYSMTIDFFTSESPNQIYTASYSGTFTSNCILYKDTAVVKVIAENTGLGEGNLICKVTCRYYDNNGFLNTYEAVVPTDVYLDNNQPSESGNSFSSVVEIPKAAHKDKDVFKPTVVIEAGHIVKFYMVTPKQMSEITIYTNLGDIKIDLVEGNDEKFRLVFSDDSPEDLRGRVIVEYPAELIEYIFSEIIVTLNSRYLIESVMIKGVLGDLINEDLTWRMAEIQRGVGEVKDAIENIDVDTSGLAKQGSNPNVSLTSVQTQASIAATNAQSINNSIGTSADISVSTTLFGWLKSIRDFLVGIVTTNPYAKESTTAKQGSNSNATLSEIQSAVIMSGTTVSDAVSYNIQQVGNMQGYLQNTVAKESTLGLSPDASVSTTIFGWLKSIRDFLVGIVTTEPYAKQGNDQTATNTAQMAVLNTIATNMYKGIPIVSQSGNATISPNMYNIWSNVSTDLVITKGNDISGIVNEYAMRFTLDSTWVTGTNTITFSGWQLDWNGGSVPTWTAGHTYEISIINNIALWVDIEPTA